MRALPLLAALLVVAGCSNNDQTDNTQNVDENLTAENIVSNDVTAIDAVTADAANMAADAAVNDVGTPLDNNSNLTTPPKPKPQTVKAPPKPAKTPPPAKAATDATDNAQ